MDTPMIPMITVAGLGRRFAAGRFPLLIDVRREERYAEAADVIRGARRRRPDRLEYWAQDLPAHGEIVVYCVHGHEVSQGVCSGLLKRGFSAAYLEGGIEAWHDSGAPLQAKPPADPSHWITRERPKIDRIACPWLIRRFIDPDARFSYVPAERVFAASEELGAIPYDIPGAGYGHEGEECSFDTVIRRHGLGDDVALMALARIVRGADTGRPDLAPQAAGLLAVSLGLSVMYQNDDAMLTQGMPIYDALYAWCASARSEQHGWPPVV